MKMMLKDIQRNHSIVLFSNKQVYLTFYLTQGFCFYKVQGRRPKTNDSTNGINNNQWNKKKNAKAQFILAYSISSIKIYNLQDNKGLKLCQNNNDFFIGRILIKLQASEKVKKLQNCTFSSNLNHSNTCNIIQRRIEIHSL